MRGALQPLARLDRAAAEIGRTGDASRRLPDPHREDEVGRLATTLNTMLESLERARDSERRFLADAIVLDGAVIAFQLAVGLRVVRAGADVRHATQPDELFEVAGDELRAVVADDPRPCVGELFASPLQEDLDILLGHGLASLPMHDVAAVAVQHGAEVVKRAGDVEVRDVDLPMRVRRERLHEAVPFLDGDQWWRFSRPC